MRIVAGRYRRRKLQTSPGLITRPIPDRVKEVLFENLGGEFRAERVADVFAGTGTIGLEALSRGAKRVIFFEKDRRARELLTANIAMLGCEADTYCWGVDVLRTSFRPKGLDEFLPYDFVFFDPPYRMVSGLQPNLPLYKSLERLARSAVTSADARLMVRIPEHADVTIPPCWQSAWSLNESSMTLLIFDKAPVSEPDETPANAADVGNSSSIAVAPNDPPDTDPPASSE